MITRHVLKLLRWDFPKHIQHLSPTDLTIVGAASGGLLALAGEEFGKLLDSNMRIRILDN